MLTGAVEPRASQVAEQACLRNHREAESALTLLIGGARSAENINSVRGTQQHPIGRSAERSVLSL